MPSVLISFHFPFLSLSPLCASAGTGEGSVPLGKQTATPPRKGQPLAGATMSTPACRCQHTSCLCLPVCSVSPAGRLHAWASSCGLPSCVLCVDRPASPATPQAWPGGRLPDCTLWAGRVTVAPPHRSEMVAILKWGCPAQSMWGEQSGYTRGQRALQSAWPWPQHPLVRGCSSKQACWSSCGESQGNLGGTASPEHQTEITLLSSGIPLPTSS